VSRTNALYPGLKGTASGGCVYTSAKLLNGKKSLVQKSLVEPWKLTPRRWAQLLMKMHYHVLKHLFEWLGVLCLLNAIYLLPFDGLESPLD